MSYSIVKWYTRLPRRRRTVLATATLGIIAVAAILMAFLLFDTKPQTYRYGEDIEGITSNLARDLPADHPEVTFVDVAQEAGIYFKHFTGRRSSQLPEDMGSGAAWGDYNQDGWPDLFIANLAGPLDEAMADTASSALFRNNGDGTFTNVTEEAGLRTNLMGMAVAWGDYNNDSYPDLILSAFNAIKLYKNQGNGTFSDQTARIGLDQYQGFWAGASWADFNNDSWLDLYVCGYTKYRKPEKATVSLQYQTDVPASINPSSFPPERNLLLKNIGGKTFVDIAENAGVANASGRSLSAAWCDFDEDGLVDLYVANDVSDNALYRNLGNESFEEISLQALVADYRGAMGIAVGDWDIDQDMDLFITHWIAQENALFSNQRMQIYATGRAAGSVVQFMDEADRFGLGQVALDYIGWGTSFFDFDNDGRLDLFVANGSTFQQADKPWLLQPMQDQLFWNRGAQTGFYDLSAVAGAYFNEQHVGRGVAFADYDRDGDVDILIVNHDGEAVLLQNRGGNQNNYFCVELKGTRSNRSAIGAKLRLWAGNNTYIRQIGAQASYLSQNSTIQHFGLGKLSQVDSLQVGWPSGAVDMHYRLPINSTIQLIERQ